MTTAEQEKLEYFFYEFWENTAAKMTDMTLEATVNMLRQDPSILNRLFREELKYRSQPEQDYLFTHTVEN